MSERLSKEEREALADALAAVLTAREMGEPARESVGAAYATVERILTARTAALRAERDAALAKVAEVERQGVEG